MVSSPIESYLGQLRSKLELRFESECADQLLSEIRSHLVDAAAELEEEGVSAYEAERLSVARFGAPEKAAFLLPLGTQFGTGDRYWGRGAFWASVGAALGLTWYALDPTGHRIFSRNEVPLILTLILAFYAYACWKAKSFSMARQSSGVIALILVVTGLFRVHYVDPAFGEAVDGRKFEGLRVQRSVPVVGAPLSNLRPSISDLGLRGSLASETSPSVVLASDPGPPPTNSVDSDEGPRPRVFGMAPLGFDPWQLTQEGLLPEVSQLLLTWLFLILMTNASICWVGCLEHEQKGGVMLVQ